MSSTENQDDNISFSISEDKPSIQVNKTDIETDSNVNGNISYSNNNTITLNDQIQKYIKENNPYVIIMTPCYGSICYVNYLFCLINTITMFRELNIRYAIEICKNDSLVSRARNNLIAKAMTKEESTHLLFIDNDITWEPLDILKLLISDKSLIGGVYPLKKYNWNNLLINQKNPEDKNPLKTIMDRKEKSQFGHIITPTDMVQHNLLNYNINYLTNNLEISNNLACVRHIATGFMMIKRGTIEKMMEAFPSTKYVDDVGFLEPTENKYAYALFDCGVEEGHYFSEDWLFCDRWMKMGGTIYIDVSINLKHTGIEDYNGSYLASII